MGQGNHRSAGRGQGAGREGYASMRPDAGGDTQKNTENRQRTTRRDRQSHCQPEGVPEASYVHVQALCMKGASMYVRTLVGTDVPMCTRVGDEHS